MIRPVKAGLHVTNADLAGKELVIGGREEQPDADWSAEESLYFLFCHHKLFNTRFSKILWTF